eukprot:3982713-Pyramimonas_sp.AAC.1
MLLFFVLVLMLPHPPCRPAHLPAHPPTPPPPMYAAPLLRLITARMGSFCNSPSPRGMAPRGRQRAQDGFRDRPIYPKMVHSSVQHASKNTQDCPRTAQIVLRAHQGGPQEANILFTPRCAHCDYVECSPFRFRLAPWASRWRH